MILQVAIMVQEVMVTNGKGSNAYADGYTADGMFYSNGSGGRS